MHFEISLEYQTRTMNRQTNTTSRQTSTISGQMSTTNQKILNKALKVFILFFIFIRLLFSIFL